VVRITAVVSTKESLTGVAAGVVLRDLVTRAGEVTGGLILGGRMHMTEVVLAEED